MKINKPSRRRTAGAGNQKGFTIVELVVAILLLTIGVVGLTTTSAYVTRQMGGSKVKTIAASIAQNRFDSLTSIGCSVHPVSASGSATQRGGIVEVWEIKDTAGLNVKKINVQLIVPKLRGLKDTLKYTSYIPCRAMS